MHHHAHAAHQGDGCALKFPILSTTTLPPKLRSAHGSPVCALPLPPPCQTIDNLTGFDIRKLYELATVTSLLLHALFVWVLVLATRAVSHTEWW